LMKSSDGGATWTAVQGLPADLGHAASPYVIDANTYLLGTKNAAGSGIFRSADGGTTWTKVYDKAVIGPAIVNGAKVQWLEANGAGVVTTADGGVTFTEAPAGGRIDPNAVGLVPLPGGALATWSANRVLRSDDDGKTWTPVGSALPYTPSGLAYSPARNTFYAARFDCSFTDDNPVKSDSFIRLDVAS
jgi:hypothetical protein